MSSLLDADSHVTAGRWKSGGNRKSDLDSESEADPT